MSDAPRKIAVVAPDGARGLMSEEDVPGALEAGFRTETPAEAKTREEEAKFGDRPIAAGAAAFGRGATLGLSDVALSKTGLVGSETLKGLQEHNQTASVVGEVAGAVAPMLIPGVGEFTAGGLAAKAGAGAVRGAEALGAGKVIAAGLGAAAEGGVFGLGSAISEDVLEDGNLDLAGEKLLTHVGLNAVMGAGIGAGGAAIEKVLGRAFRRVGAKAAGAVEEGAEAAATPAAAEALGEATASAPANAGSKFRIPDIEDLPDDEAISGAVKRHAGTIKEVIGKLGFDELTPEKILSRHLDLTGSQVGKLKAKGIDQSSMRALLDDARIEGATTLDKSLALIRAKQSEAADAIGKSVSKFDELVEPAERLRPLDIANRIDDELIAPLKNGNALNDPMIAQLRKQSQRLRKLDQAAGGGGMSFKEAEELKRSFDPFLKWDSQTPGPLQDKLRKLRGIINNEIENSVEEVAIRTGSLEPLDAWKAAKKSYGEMAELEKHVANRAAARDGNRYFSLTDYISGGAAVSGALDMTDGDGPDPIGLAKLGVGMLANKWARERLAHVMALQLDALLKNKTAQVAAKGFFSAFKKAEATATEAAAKTPAIEAVANAATQAAAPVAEAVASGASGFWSKYGPALSTAAAKGANALYATHVALSHTDPDYGSGVQMAGFPRETPGDTRAGMVRASKLAAIQEAAHENDRSVDEAVGGFLRGGGRTPAQPKMSAQEFKKRFGELSDLVSNPQALVDRLQGGATLANVAPGVATAVASTASRAVQFLHDKAPKNPYAAAMPGMERAWEPSGAEVTQWGRYVRAIEDPRSVLDDMRRGSVTQEAVEAMRAVYPQLAQDVQARLISAMAEGKKPLSYQQRVSIATLMGKQLEPTMDPAQVAALQAIHGQAQQAQQQQNPPATGQRIRVQDASTPSQRIEGKHG